MVSVIRRTRKLQTLLSIRAGPGAAVLPEDVTRIHMDFAIETANGHKGAKSFWRNHLVRLKYHNPRIPMIVERTADNAAPATMTLSFADNRTEVIDMKHRDDSAILTQLLALTKARVVRTSPEDVRLGQELAEKEASSSRVRGLMLKVQAARKHERDILAQARGEVEALRNED